MSHLYPTFNQAMSQFTVLRSNNGTPYLMVIDTSRWGYWIGFRRFIKVLSDV